MPFVFAVWAARPGVLNARDVLLLQGSLEAGLAERAADRAGVGAQARRRCRAAPRVHDARDPLRARRRALRGPARVPAPRRRAKLLPRDRAALRRRRRAADRAAPTRAPQRSIDDLLEYAAGGGRLSLRGRDAARARGAAARARASPPTRGARRCTPTASSRTSSTATSTTPTSAPPRAASARSIARSATPRATCSRASSWARRSTRPSPPAASRSCCRAGSTPRCSSSGTRICSAG